MKNKIQDMKKEKKEKEDFLSKLDECKDICEHWTKDQLRQAIRIINDIKGV